MNTRRFAFIGLILTYWLISCCGLKSYFLPRYVSRQKFSEGREVKAYLAFPNLNFCDMYGFMKRLNWHIWAGFILSLIAGFSYLFVFVRWPVTRDFPWVNLIFFAIALVFLFLGLRRAFKPDKGIVSKIFSSLAAALGLLMLIGLLFSVFVIGRRLPASPGAPQAEHKAPEFTLTDSNNKQVTLAQLLSEPINNKPPKGVLLIFYRGYW